MRGRARGVLSRLPSDVAAARGRDARALRRAGLARRAPAHRPRRARRRAAPLPRRMGRRPPRRRPDGAAAGLGALRGGEHSGAGCPFGTARRTSGRARRDGARLGQLAHALPRRLRADVQPLPAHERALVPRAPRRGRARGAQPLGAVGTRGACGDREPSLRGSRLRLAGRLRSRARENEECARRRWRSWRSPRRPSGSQTGCSPNGSTPARRAGIACRCSAIWPTRRETRPPASCCVLVPILALAALGWWRLRAPARLLAACVVVVPALVLGLARFGDAASPESRHLIFALPFFSTALAAGLVALTRRRAILAGALVLLLVAEVGWAWHRTPALFEGESAARIEARQAASAWLAETARPDDVLFGYDPVFLRAWERHRDFPATVVPRADAKLALSELRSAGSLGTGCLGSRRRRQEQPPPALDDCARASRREPSRDAPSGPTSCFERASPPGPRPATSCSQPRRCASASGSESSTLTAT